jgi:phosphatidylglycerophosphatase A
MKMKKFLLLTFISGFGSGFTPVIPGTAGSLVAAIIYYFLPAGNILWLIIIILTFAAGAAIGGRIEKEYGKDPSFMVIDEFAGQWLTYSALPMDLLIFAGGFLLFRVFDILKPFPANRAQNISGGPGIMLDDLIAAVYAQITIRIILLIIKRGIS